MTKDSIEVDIFLDTDKNNFLSKLTEDSEIYITVDEFDDGLIPRVVVDGQNNFYIGRELFKRFKRRVKVTVHTL